jgi:hypothetical protein
MTIPLVPALAQAAPARDTLALASDVAGIVMAIAVVVVAFLAGLLFVRLNRVLAETRRGMHQAFGPVSDGARAISDNVEFVTQVLRSDVESVNASVRALTDRLTLASELMEDRIGEFNALMEVVQGEAEDLFVDTAAAVRGVREGARSIAAASERRRPEADRVPEDVVPEPPPEVPAGHGRPPVITHTEEGRARPDGGR